MLENLRRQGSSVFIYVIFGILIAMFVINFRPGGQRGDDAGCTGSPNTAITVDGSEVTLTSFRVAYGAFEGSTRARTATAFEAMIRRELLANEAHAHGLIVGDSLIDEQLKLGNFFLAGNRQNVADLFDTHEDGTKTWNIRKFKNWVQERFNVSLSTFRDEQQRELQASLMTQILGDEVHVSRDEALNDWLYDHNTVTYDSVVFRPEAYAAAMHLTDDDAARFLTTHGDEVKARFDADKTTYEKVNPQIQVREIYIAKLEPEAPAPKPGAGSAAAAGSGAGSAAAAGSGAGSAAVGSGAAAAAKPAHDPLADAEAAEAASLKVDAPKPAATPVKKPEGMPIEQAKAKLEAAAADIKAGKKKFADVAKELSSGDQLKWNGGELGWRTTDAPALGDKLVNDAVKTMKVGDVSPVIVTDKGAYLVTVEGTRGGKLEFDAVKLEIAATLAKDVWSHEAAHRDALAALDHARAGTGKNLDQLFEREAERPEMDPELQKILSDPSIPTKTKQELIQQYIQMGQRHGWTGTISGTDQPVAWYADSDNPNAPPPPGSAATPTPAPTPAPGSAATPTPTPGSAATPAKTPAPALPPVDLSKPSSDVLPAFGTVAAPKVNKSGPTPKQAKLPGIGTSKAAADALFDELTPGMLAKTLYLTEGNYVVIQLLEKSAPKVDDFDKEADHVIAELRTRRGASAVEDWLQNRCEALAKTNRITWNKDLLRDTTADGKPVTDAYKPCQSFHRAAGGGGEGLDLGGPDEE